MLTLTKENFEQEVLQSDRPVLVDFWAPWCVYCRRIAPAFDRMDGQSDVVLAKINIDEQPELAERFDVTVIPTFYLFQNGVPGDKLIAPGSQAQIEDWVNAQRQSHREVSL